MIPRVEQLLLKRDADRAKNLLLQITNRSPPHVRTLQKLVEVARIRQNDRAIVQALSNLLEAHLAAGSDRAAEDTAAQLVEVEPDNEQFKARLESLRKKKAAPVLSGPAKVAVEKKAAADVTLPPPVAAVGSDLEGLEFDTGAIVRPKGISADSNTDREFIEEHLAESRVFRKYGLLDKAEEQVDLVLNRYPNIFDGRFEKKEIFKETERLEEAARECLWLAGVARKDGNESLGKMLSDEAQTLWPGISDEAPEEAALDVEAAEPPAELSLDALAETPPAAFEALPEAGLEGASELPSMDLAAEAPPAAEEEEELNLEMGVEDETPDAPVAEDTAPSFEAPAEMSASQSAEADALAAGFGEADSELESPPPALALPASEEAGPDAGFASGSFARPIGLGAAPGADPEIAKAVEEVDSYIALGFVDDAKDALRDALSRFPGNESLLERASSLGLDLQAKPAAAPAPPPVPRAAAAPAPPPPAAEPPAGEDDLLSGLSFDDLPPAPEPAETPAAVNMRVTDAAPITDAGGIDLGAELSALFDAQPALEEAPVDTSRSSSFEDQGLQDVFNEFKKGVDSQLGEGDYDTRYNLGIAYKEMGLVDEAIAEFQLAAKDPKRSLECSSMIGICFMEKGMADVAVQWYERGLQVPGRAPEEYRGLRYDLGIAWEAAGELAKAKATFADLVREDPSFRDVSDKLRDLQARA